MVCGVCVCVCVRACADVQMCMCDPPSSYAAKQSMVVLIPSLLRCISNAALPCVARIEVNTATLIPPSLSPSLSHFLPLCKHVNSLFACESI